MRGLISLALLLIMASSSTGDELDSYPEDSAQVSNAADSSHQLRLKDYTVPATYAEQPVDSVRYQNPTVALFKSMLIPGLGQIGNRRYIKAGLAIALESVFIGAIIRWRGKTGRAWDEFQAAPDSAIDSRAVLYNTYLRYKDKRNFYSWMLGTTIFLSMFDAYVDAHLLKFPKFREEDEKGLSLDFGPTDIDRYRLTLTYHF